MQSLRDSLRMEQKNKRQCTLLFNMAISGALINL